MLRRAFFGLTLAVLASLVAPTPAVRAQDPAQAELKLSSAQVRKAVIALIDAQLQAFRAHDLKKAYSLAAPALRAQVPMAQFVNIVKSGYPEVWANQSATYGIVRSSDERATVDVKVKGADGSASYDYILLKGIDGWRVGGVLRHVLQPDTAL